MVPLIAMMVWMGVYSQSFLPPVSKTTAAVLEQTEINVPFCVQVRPADPTDDLQARGADASACQPIFSQLLTVAAPEASSAR